MVGSCERASVQRFGGMDMNRSTVLCMISSACAGTALWIVSASAGAQASRTVNCDLSAAVYARPECSSDAAAAKSKAPTLSHFLLKDMKAAQDAQKAQNWKLEVQKLQAALAAKGKRTPYDDYLINSWLGIADAQLQNYADAAPALQAAAESQYAPVAQQKVMLSTAISLFSQLHQYPQAIAAGQSAMKRGLADSSVYVNVAVAQNGIGQYQQAATTIQQLIKTESTPEEKYLAFQWQAYNQAGDQADASKVIDQLVTYYPKPDYWFNALQPLLKMNSKDAHLQLEVYRLMNEVGALKTASDYAQMAQLAFDAGYPGEAVTVLQKAFAINVFTDQNDVMRYQHLLTSAMQKAAADEASLPAQEAKAETAATGDQLVAIGTAYLSYGQADKAASVISQGIAKGGLTYPQEANLLLGMAQLKGDNAAAARGTFDKVGESDNGGYAQLGKLWALHSAPHAAA
jgi:hypothetical protein